MKVLFIGTGSIGKRHCVNIRKLIPDVELYFFRESGLADTFSLQMNAKIITSMNQVTSEIDAAFLCAPSYLRKVIYERIFDLNIPLYAEKPLASSTSDITWLKVALQTYTAPSLIGFNLRFLPVIDFVKEFIKSNKLGNVCRAYFEVGQFLPDWRPAVDYRTVYSAKRSMGGGVVLDLMHEVDLAYCLFGKFVNALVVSNKFSSLEINTDDTAAIILHRNSNPIITINMDYVSRRPIRQFSIVGDLATLSCDLLGKRLTVGDANSCEKIILEDNFYDVNRSYITAVEEFLSAVEEKSPSPYSLLDSLQMHEVILERI